MNEQKNKGFSPPAVGGVTLLSVFAVLCLTIFALLSLSTVSANGRLSDASAKAVSDYYAADVKAQRVLALLRSGADIQAAAEENTVDGITADGDVYSYSCKISERQTLEVEVRVDGDNYAVRKWQAVPSGEWNIDSSLPVWDGETATVNTKKYR